MAGRRSHLRFGVSQPWEGALRILRDAVVQRTEAGELLAVSHTPGVVGEVLSLDLLGGGATLEMKVLVLESRPVIVDGAVRHRLRLDVRAAPRDEDEPRRQWPETSVADASPFAGEEA